MHRFTRSTGILLALALLSAACNGGKSAAVTAGSAATGSASGTGSGSAPTAAPSLADKLALLRAGAVPAPLNQLTMPPAERDELLALRESSPEQVLAIQGDKLDATGYAALATYPGRVLVILGITTISAPDAGALAGWRGDTLFLDITELAPDAAGALAHWQGTSLHLDHLTTLSEGTATTLSSWRGQTLGLGHADVAPDAAAVLARDFRGNVAISLAHAKVDATGVPPPAESDVDLEILKHISQAIDAGDVDAVRAYLAGGGAVDMNERGTTLLMEATNTKQVAVAKLLVEAHANVNAVSGDGNTPLYYALNDFPPIPENTPANVSALVHLLVEAGADVNAKGAGDLWVPPIQQATKRGDKALVAYLKSKASK